MNIKFKTSGGVVYELRPGDPLLDAQGKPKLASDFAVGEVAYDGEWALRSGPSMKRTPGTFQVTVDVEAQSFEDAKKFALAAIAKHIKESTKPKKVRP